MSVYVNGALVDGGGAGGASPLVLNNNVAVQGRNTPGGTAFDLAKVAASNEATFGNTSLNAQYAGFRVLLNSSNSDLQVQVSGAVRAEVGTAAVRFLSLYQELDEVAAPAAPAANKLRAFACDVNGFTCLAYLVNGAAAPDVLVTSDGSFTGRVQTTNATVTTVLTVPLDDNTTTKVFVEVAGQSDGANTGAAYERVAAYRRNDAGAPALIGAVATPFTAEDTAGWDVTLTLSGNNLLVQVTGAAATTIDWVARATVHKAT